MGYYMDNHDIRRWAFLGYTLKEAHARLEYIKRGSILRATGTGYPLKSRAISSHSPDVKSSMTGLRCLD